MYESGFRTNHSTDFCLAQVIDFFFTGMNKQMHTGMVLVGFFEKIKYFGFQISVHKWLEYLSNRIFLVCVDNVFSEAGTLKYVVPQGSILG